MGLWTSRDNSIGYHGCDCHRGQLRLLLPSLAEFSVGILGSWQMEGRDRGPPPSKLAGMHPLPPKRGQDASSHTLGVVHCVYSQRDLEKRGLTSDSDF